MHEILADSDTRVQIRTSSHDARMLCNLWPGAVAAEEILSEQVLVQPVGIARDKVSILKGMQITPSHNCYWTIKIW